VERNQTKEHAAEGPQATSLTIQTAGAFLISTTIYFALDRRTPPFPPGFPGR